MLKINPLSTLYVGIDVSSKSNYVCALDFFKNKYINSSFANNQPGAEELALKILECLKEHPDITTIVAALESTSVYSIHIANYLSSCEELMRFKSYVFVLNPKCTANYKKSYIGLGKSDCFLTPQPVQYPRRVSGFRPTHPRPHAHRPYTMLPLCWKHTQTPCVRLPLLSLRRNRQ